MIEPGLWQTARQLQRFLESQGFEYCLIGGIACQRWGQPRVTEDVDATVLIDFGGEKPMVDTLTGRYESRVPNPQQFALQHRIVLLKDIHGFGIDVSLGGLPFERRMIQRASNWDAPENGSIRTCSAEDLIVLKSFAARPLDWIDVENIIIRQADELDRDLILEELEPLVKLKEEPEILDQLVKLFRD